MAKELIAVLNELEEAGSDAAATLHRAAENARSPSLRATFEEHTTVLRRICQELQDLVVEWNETPAESGTSAGALRRGFATMRDALAGPDDAQLLAECMRSIEHAEPLYRAASITVEPEPTKALLAKHSLQLQSLRADLASLLKAFSAPPGA